MQFLPINFKIQTPNSTMPFKKAYFSSNSLKPLSKDTVSFGSIEEGFTFEREEGKYVNTNWIDAVNDEVPKFRKFDKFGLKEYKKLNKKEKEILREFVNKPYNSYNDSVKNDLKVIKKAYNCIKSTLDEKYPEGYVFASIGASPALFAKMFELDGVEAKIFPFSRVAHLQDLTTYFNKLGLTKDFLKNCDKKIIFNDYACSGMTLSYFKDKIQSCNLLDEDKMVLYLLKI